MTAMDLFEKRERENTRAETNMGSKKNSIKNIKVNYDNVYDWITSDEVFKTVQCAVLEWIYPGAENLESFQEFYDSTTGERIFLFERASLQLIDEIIEGSEEPKTKSKTKEKIEQLSNTLVSHLAAGWLWCALNDFIEDANTPSLDGEKLVWLDLAKRQFAYQIQMGHDQEQLKKDLLICSPTKNMVTNTIDVPLKKLYKQSLLRNNDSTWEDVREAFISHLHQVKFTREIVMALYHCYEHNEDVKTQVSSHIDDALERAAFTVQSKRMSLSEWRGFGLDDSDQPHIHSKAFYCQQLFSNMPVSGISLIEEHNDYVPGISMHALETSDKLKAETEEIYLDIKFKDGNFKLSKVKDPLHADYKYSKKRGLKEINDGGVESEDGDDLRSCISDFDYSHQIIYIDFETANYECTPSRWKRMYSDIKLSSQTMLHMLGPTCLGYPCIDLDKIGVLPVVTKFCKTFIESALRTNSSSEWFNKYSSSNRLRHAASLCTFSHQFEVVEVKYALAVTALEGLIAVPYSKGMNKENITLSLKKRIGVLLEPESEYRNKAEKKIEDIYNRRSKFIHASPKQGLEISDKDYEEVFTLLSSVMLSLIHFDNFHTSSGHNEENEEAMAKKDKELFSYINASWETGKPMEYCFAPTQARKLWVDEKYWDTLEDPLR